MSQCQVAGCLGTASATTDQCSVCSVPIECPTLGCKNVPVVLAVGCNWCPNCNRPTSARVPTQAVAQALQATGTGHRPGGSRGPTWVPRSALTRSRAVTLQGSENMMENI